MVREALHVAWRLYLFELVTFCVSTFIILCLCDYIVLLYDISVLLCSYDMCDSYILLRLSDL